MRAWRSTGRWPTSTCPTRTRVRPSSMKWWKSACPSTCHEASFHEAACMRLLLLGANGQVGHELRRSLAPLGDVVATTRNGLLDDGVACERIDLCELDAIE